jgi:ATP citrate (pro-S)-lyase
MRLLGESLGVPIRVFGPDTHITDILPLALSIDISKTKGSNAGIDGLKSVQVNTPPAQVTAASEPVDAIGSIHPDGERTQPSDHIVHFGTKCSSTSRPAYRPFDANTRSFVYGLQPRAKYPRNVGL